MKKFNAKVIVRMKPSVKDIKGETLKNAVESIQSVQNLTCYTGNVYWFYFDAEDQAQALHIVENIAQEILLNEVIEEYDIRYINEVDEED